MPISKSAKKALRSSEAKREKNLVLKVKLKKAIKKSTAETLNEAYSTIDKSVKRHLIHRNKAAHLKSQLAKKFATGAVASKKTVTKKKSNKTTKKQKNK